MLTTPSYPSKPRNNQVGRHREATGLSWSTHQTKSREIESMENSSLNGTTLSSTVSVNVCKFLVVSQNNLRISFLNARSHSDRTYDIPLFAAPPDYSIKFG
jgi:hypothetical protein